MTGYWVTDISLGTISVTQRSFAKEQDRGMHLRDLDRWSQCRMSNEEKALSPVPNYSLSHVVPKMPSCESMSDVKASLFILLGSVSYGDFKTQPSRHIKSKYHGTLHCLSSSRFSIPIVWIPKTGIILISNIVLNRIYFA